MPNMRFAWMPVLLVALFVWMPISQASGLDNYAYYPNYLPPHVRKNLDENWQKLDTQAARQRMFLMESQKACHLITAQNWQKKYGRTIDLMINKLSATRPNAPDEETLRAESRSLANLHWNSPIPHEEMVRFHLYFLNRLESEQAKAEAQACTPTTSQYKLDESTLRQEVFRSTNQVHKMTTYISQVEHLVAKCDTKNFNTYMDPLEQLSDRLMELKSQALTLAVHKGDEGPYGLADKLFDEVMLMRNRLEALWARKQCH